MPHRELRGYKEGNGLMSRTVFISLTYCCFSIRIQKMASSPQDALALLKEEKSLYQTPVSLVQFNKYTSTLLFSCRCAVILYVLYQKLILLFKELIYYLKGVIR